MRSPKDYIHRPRLYLVRSLEAKPNPGRKPGVNRLGGATYLGLERCITDNPGLGNTVVVWGKIPNPGREPGVNRPDVPLAQTGAPACPPA